MRPGLIYNDDDRARRALAVATRTVDSVAFAPLRDIIARQSAHMTSSESPSIPAALHTVGLGIAALATQVWSNIYVPPLHVEVVADAILSAIETPSTSGVQQVDDIVRLSQMRHSPSYPSV